MEQPFTHSGTRDPAPSPREQENAALARQAAAAGIVLLKNRGVLPLNPGAPVALFGAEAGRTVKGGTGSGDVNNRASVSIWQGLKEAGVPLTSEDWLADCEARYTRAREDWRAQVLAAAKQVDNPFDAYAARPFALPEGRTIRPQDLKGAKAALYVISRIAGEGKDRRLEPGDYYLSDAERADLQTLDESGLPVVLLLNAGGPVELTGLLDGMQHLDAILQLSQLGQQGGQAVADVLLGRAVPEGKLTATWARRYDDIPCARAFGSLNGDVSQDTYRDGVYVGYRYFDSFGVRPLFAFGFGLSYTTFALRAAGLDVQPGHLAVQVEVANTGARFAGREVAQVYLSAPQGELPRERRRLAGFAKTRRLAPGETQTLTLEIPQKQLAAFHPEQNAWVVDAGLYGVWVGNSSDALRLSLIMADGPAGLRLRQCYQADRATGEVYGAGVLGSLENGFLEAPPRHESADTYYQFCTAFPVGTALAQSWDPRPAGAGGSRRQPRNGRVPCGFVAGPRHEHPAQPTVRAQLRVLFRGSAAHWHAGGGHHGRRAGIRAARGDPQAFCLQQPGGQPYGGGRAGVGARPAGNLPARV